MDNKRFPSVKTETPLFSGQPPPSRGMPQSFGAGAFPDLNVKPEVQDTTGGSSDPPPGPSNPQPGPSNPQPGPSNPHGPKGPEEDPPDSSFFRSGVVNPKPFFTGKVAGALESMRKLLVKMRERCKHEKEGRTPKRKYTKRGRPESEDKRKRTKRPPADDSGLA